MTVGAFGEIGVVELVAAQLREVPTGLGEGGLGGAEFGQELFAVGLDVLVALGVGGGAQLLLGQVVIGAGVRPGCAPFWKGDGCAGRRALWRAGGVAVSTPKSPRGFEADFRPAPASRRAAPGASVGWAGDVLSRRPRAGVG